MGVSIEEHVLLEIENEKAMKSVVMGLLRDGWTVQLFDRPDDFAVRAWKEESG